MAACNGEKYISNQINSILKQQKVFISLKIGVDISSDKTLLICREFEKNNKNIEVIENNDTKTFAAKNFYKLIKFSNFQKYDFIAFSDQDDFWFKNKLIDAINTLANKNIDAYSSDVIACWNNKKKYIKKSFKQKKFDYIFESPGPGCTFVLNKESFEFLNHYIIDKWNDIIGFKQHDWLIYAILRTNNFQWIIHNKANMYYLQHDKNVFGANEGLKAAIKRFKMILNNWYKKEIIELAKIIHQDDNKITSIFLNYRWPKRYNLIFSTFMFRRRLRDVIILFFFFLFGLF